MAAKLDREYNKYRKNSAGKLVRGPFGETYLNVFDPANFDAFGRFRTSSLTNNISAQCSFTWRELV